MKRGGEFLALLLLASCGSEIPDGQSRELVEYWSAGSGR